MLFPIFVFGQYTSIPDSMFEQRLIDLGYDTIHDGQVLTADIVNIDTLILIPPLGGFFVAIPYNTISDFTGIEDFINLTYFDCRYNSITSLDLSYNTLLNFLDCSGFHNGYISMGQLTSLNINQNIFLDTLKCSGNQLDSLNVSQNINLKSLVFGKTIFNPMGNDYSGNNISNIDLSQNINLTNLECSDNLLTNLDLSNNTFLSYLDCRKNQISNINITNCNGLTSFNCSNNLLINLNVSQNINLGDMNCSNNLLTNLNLSQNIVLGDLDCSNNNIDTLDMTQNPNLFKLSCHNNNLTELNINQNILLGDLNCNNNFLDTLDITQNPNLWFLRCENNLMSYLDLTYNTLLSDLRCSNNQLNILNTNNLSFLSRLFCSDNQLVSLDIRNTSLDSGFFGALRFRATNNPDLHCISVDDSIWATNNWSSNWTGSWPPSIDSQTIFSNNCNILQYTLIPDSIFEQVLINLGYDTIHDGQVLTANISSIDSLHLQAPFAATVRISDLTGIEDFVSLTYLYCSYQHLTNLDLSQNPNLTHLICAGQYPWNSNLGLNNLDVSQNPNLTYLKCNSNELISLDLTQNNTLNYLECRGNNLTNLDISQNTNLTFLDCNVNQLTSLDVSQNIALDTLDCSINQISNLDFSQNTNLSYLDCQQNPLILSLDLSQNINLNWVFLHNNQLVSLDVRNGNNTNLFLRADNNPNLNCISVDDSVWAATNWNMVDNHTIFSYNCDYSSQYTLIPDSAFEQRLIDYGYDTIQDGKVLTSNISSIDSLDVSTPPNMFSPPKIYDLTGIESFINLRYLNCGFNELTNLDLSQNNLLNNVMCGFNNIQNLNISQNSFLNDLMCGFNNIQNLNTSQNINLEKLMCSQNPISNLNLTQNINLKTLNCAYMSINDLDVSQNLNLDTINCGHNQILNLNLSDNQSLIALFCDFNRLKTLDIRNGNNINFTDFEAFNNDSLYCISVDDSSWSANNWSASIDSQTVFSTNCNPSTVDIIENLNNFLTYPNPTNENVTISMEDYNGNILTKVYDLIGNELLITNETTISLKDYAKGVYIFKVSFGDTDGEVKVVKE